MGQLLVPALSIYGKMLGLKFLSVLIRILWGVFIQSRPLRFFNIVWGLPAGTEDQLATSGPPLLEAPDGGQAEDYAEAIHGCTYWPGGPKPL